jgi:hypothetical protein
MSSAFRATVAAMLLVPLAAVAVGQPPGDLGSPEAFAARARRAGLRVIESERLVLVTDRPARDGDGVEDLAAVFAEAVAAWCRHYGLAATVPPEWRACGCLVVDRERFRAAGLLPASVPDFANGFCAGGTFWLQDQSNPAYRRHLLLHEGAHAFTLTVRGLATPAWYNEGVAELLATHRLEAAGDRPAFVATPMPSSAADVEQLGRIEELRELRRQGRPPALDDVLAMPAGDHRALSDYAASWAAVVLFSRHPAYAAPFAAIERGPLGPDFNDRLAAMPGFDLQRASRDYDALTDDLDYGYDFARSAIDWSPGRPGTFPARVGVAAGRGWQNAGFAITEGRRYALRATGRCMLGRVDDTPIETEPPGLSLAWYRGRPVGRLLAAQWAEHPPAGDRPRFVVLAEGAAAAITATVTGPLFLKLNEPPGELADDTGSFAVEIVEMP